MVFKVSSETFCTDPRLLWHSVEQPRELRGGQLGLFLASRKLCVEKNAMDAGYLEFLDHLELYAEPLGAMPACGAPTAAPKALVMPH